MILVRAAMDKGNRSAVGSLMWHIPDYGLTHDQLCAPKAARLPSDITVTELNTFDNIHSLLAPGWPAVLRAPDLPDSKPGG